MKLDAAVEMDVGLKELQDRITGRMSCGQCGAVYHRVSNPPKVAGVCDHCGARDLRQREDDTIEVLNTRLMEYYRKTAPLVGYYHHAGLLRRVECAGGPEEVAQAVGGVARRLIKPGAGSGSALNSKFLADGGLLPFSESLGSSEPCTRLRGFSPAGTEVWHRAPSGQILEHAVVGVGAAHETRLFRQFGEGFGAHIAAGAPQIRREGR